MPIPMVDLVRHYADLKTEIEESVIEVLRNGYYVTGSNVRSFEEEAAHFLGVPYAVAVNSGTDALHLALRALGVGPGDEVITPSFTFIATVEAILYCGATPVFIDIDPEYFLFDVAQLESLITSKTKAILPVHLYGQMVDMTSLMAIANQHQIPVVEDCAQSFGTCWQGKQSGAWGAMGCFSFYPTKNLSCCGDGGLITCLDENHYQELKALRNHGSRERYYHYRLGFNSRLDEIQAAILRVKLPYIDRFNAMRKQCADAYTELLRDVVQVPKHRADSTHIFHQYTILHPERDAIKQALSNQECASSIYYPVPIHKQQLFSGRFDDCDLPVTEDITRRCLSLPIFPEMTMQEVDQVAACVKQATVIA